MTNLLTSGDLDRPKITILIGEDINKDVQDKRNIPVSSMKSRLLEESQTLYERHKYSFVGYHVWKRL